MLRCIYDSERARNNTKATEWLTCFYTLLAESEERKPDCWAEYASAASSEVESMEEIALLSNNASEPVMTVVISNRVVTIYIGEPIRAAKREVKPWQTWKLFSVAVVYDGEENRVYHLKPRLAALIEKAVILDGPKGGSGKRYVEFGWGSAGEKRYAPQERRLTSIVKWIWTVLIGGVLASLLFEEAKRSWH